MSLLRVLYVGDIMGRPGREVIKYVLPQLRKELQLDLVIAQAENVSHGKGMSTAHMRELQMAGIDFFTGGNHTMERPSIKELLADPDEPVIAPFNQAGVEEGWGAKTVATVAGSVRIVSLLGTTFPERQETIAVNPLLAIDRYLNENVQGHVICIVNFHSDFSSEKRVIGYYLDGKVSAVIGDHWHVPTADAMVLPHGTAHITDVGMCGTLHSSLGVTKEIIMTRWHDEVQLKNKIAEGPPYQFNAVLIVISRESGLAMSVELVQKIIGKL